MSDGLRNQISLGSETFYTEFKVGVVFNQLLNEMPRMRRRQSAKPLDSYRTEHGDNPRLGMALAYLSGGTR